MGDRVVPKAVANSSVFRPGVVGRSHAKICHGDLHKTSGADEFGIEVGDDGFFNSRPATVFFVRAIRIRELLGCDMVNAITVDQRMGHSLWKDRMAHVGSSRFCHRDVLFFDEINEGGKNSVVYLNRNIHGFIDTHV